MARQIFVDTSAFKALIDKRDDFHSLAISLVKETLDQDIEWISTNYILDETITLLRIRCGLPVALNFREILAQENNTFKIVRVSIEDETKAWSWFEKDWSNLSFTDCVSFAFMQRNEINEAFSFDKHFKRAGFELVRANNLD